jgi:hypothetical protein
MLIGEAIPGDRNAIKREAERIVKCKDVIIEIQRMWNMTAKMIPVVNKRGEWNHFIITQTLPEKRRQKARN